MIYLFIGDDSLAKDVKIQQIKQKYLSSSEAVLFDYQSLDAHKLDPIEFKKSFLALPVLSSKRIILIRQANKLHAQVQEIIFDFLKKDDGKVVLILDAFELDERSSLFAKLKGKATVELFQKAKKSNVFDVTNALGAGNLALALKMLSKLQEEGNHPLQIIGGLLWFWGKSKNRLTKDYYKKGLLIFQEADLNIKRSRISPEYALELLVTKLSSILAY